MIPTPYTKVTTMGRDKPLSKKGMPYRLELGQHHTKLKIKDQKSKLQLKMQNFLTFSLYFGIFIFAFCIS